MARKRFTDILAMVMLICALFTGFKLHKEVHHLQIYNNASLWTAHILAGLILAIALSFHCFQHKAWFKSYSKIQIKRKRVTTILLVVACMVIISGIILMCGSHSHFISIFHYVSAIIFTVLAVGHVAKRWKIFTSLFKRKKV